MWGATFIHHLIHSTSKIRWAQTVVVPRMMSDAFSALRKVARVSK